MRGVVGLAITAALAYTATQLTDMFVEFERNLASSKHEAEAAGAYRVETRVLQGAPASEIIEFARTHRCDLIVMGTHGRTGIKHALIGSIAEMGGGSCSRIAAIRRKVSSRSA